jgi:aminoglycoside phosphotransferase (APT) family kinase protein
MSAGIPGAKIYDVGTYKDYAYILMEYIDGSNGTRIEASPGLWQELGSYLNLIHKIPVKGFGEKLNDITDGNKEQWKTYLKYNIDSLNDNDVLIKLGVLDTPTSKKLITIFQGIAGNSYTFGLNHGDYSLANVIVNNKSTAHIIDWGCAQSHVVPHYDLGVILDESLSLDSDEFNALLNGYGMSRYDFDVMKQEIADLVLLEAVDKLRWALDKAPKWVESHKSRLINILQAL